MPTQHCTKFGLYTLGLGLTLVIVAGSIRQFFIWYQLFAEA